MRKFAALVATAAAVSSCSLLVDLSGLSGDGGQPVDGGLQAVDGGTAVDPDGGAADGASRRFCSAVDGSPLLCEDYDGPVSRVGWVDQIDDGGTVGVDDALAVSAPNSLRFRLPAADGPCRNARIVRASDTAYAKSVRMDLDLRVDGAGFPTDLATAELQLRDARPTSICNHYFSLRPDGTASFVVESGSDSTQNKVYPMTRGITPGRWSHLTIVLDTPRSGPLKATVWIDEAIALQQTLSNASCGYETLSRMSLGAFCPGTDVDVRVDNLVVWTE
jgi:hypothetical protein